MTMARTHLMDVSVTRSYHCITRRVGRAFLLGERPSNVKNAERMVRTRIVILIRPAGSDRF